MRNLESREDIRRDRGKLKITWGNVVQRDLKEKNIVEHMACDTSEQRRAEESNRVFHIFDLFLIFSLSRSLFHLSFICMSYVCITFLYFLVPSILFFHLFLSYFYILDPFIFLIAFQFYAYDGIHLSLPQQISNTRLW